MFDSLRHFLLIAEHGTFTVAARHAHLSQPALSASIQRLEQELGARLFDRGRGGATLTAAGLALRPHARAALTAVAEGRRAVSEVMGLEAGEVRLGAGATAVTYMLPPVLARFRERHDGIRFLLRELTTHESREALHAGELDLCLLSNVRAARAGGETVEPWIEDELVLVAAPGARTADPPPHITFRPGTTTRALFERHFADAEIVMELGSIAAVKGNVRAGIGVALVSRHAIQHDLAERRLVVVPDPRTPIRRALSLVHRGVARLSPAAAALRTLLLSAGGRPKLPRRGRARGKSRRAR